jgi:hypothetical protein
METTTPAATAARTVFRVTPIARILPDGIATKLPGRDNRVP